VPLAAAPDDERGDDGERRWEADREGRAGADAALDLDRAADALDLRVRRADAVAVETGKEDQLQGVPVVHARRLLGRDEAALERRLPDRLGLEPCAVVTDFDRDPRAVVLCTQQETTFRGLLRGGAHVGRLDPVVDGVADEVCQRLLDRFDDRLVELDVAPLELEPDLATAGERAVAHEAREPGPRAADPLP